MSSHAEIIKRIAHLESVNDHLITEIGYTDQLLRQSGFPQGLESLKQVAQEMLNNNSNYESEES